MACTTDSVCPTCNARNPFTPDVGPAPDALWDANWMNVYTYRAWRDNLLQLALTRFEWINVPKELDPRYIELTLLYQGWGAFFEPTPGRLAFCQATQVDNLDMYFNPRQIQLIPANGQDSILGAPWRRECQTRVVPQPDGMLKVVEQDAVACFDNMLRAPLIYQIEVAARRLARLDRAADVNVNAQLTPWIGVAKEEAKNDLERYMNQVVGCESVILEDEGFATDVTAAVLPTGAPFVADQLLSLQDRRFNRVCTVLGIDNAFSQKKEREVAGEMDANDEQIYLSRETALRCRQKACEEANALFHTDMQVRFSTRLLDTGGVDFSDEEVKRWDTPKSQALDSTPQAPTEG